VKSSASQVQAQVKDAVEWVEPWRNAPDIADHYMFSLTALGDKFILYGGRSYANTGTLPERAVYCLRLTM